MAVEFQRISCLYPALNMMLFLHEQKYILTQSNNYHF
jgi:hypothetical protein